MKIKIGKEKLHGKFNKSSLCQTTCNVGEVQPTLFRALIPHEKFTINNGCEVKLMPMAAPTFGMMSLRQYYSAIKVSDIYRPWHSFYSEKIYNFGNKNLYINKLPKVNIGELFLSCLEYDLESSWAFVDNVAIDPFSTRYRETGLDDYDFDITPFNSTAFQNMCLQYASTSTTADPVRNMACNTGYLRAKQYLNDWTNDYIINPQVFTHKNQNVELLTNIGAIDIIVPLVVRKVYVNNSDNLTIIRKGIAIKLGTFGKQLRKMYKGLGINIDGLFTPIVSTFAEDTNWAVRKHNFNILPFVAYCKSIYDCFGVKKFADFNQTYLCKFIQDMNNNSSLSEQNSKNGYLMTGLEKDDIPYKHHYWADDSSTLSNGANRFFNLPIIIAECLYNSYFTLDVDQFTQVNNTVGNMTGGSNSVNTIINTDSDGVVSYDRTSISTSDYEYPIITNIANKLLHYVNTNNVIGASIYKWFKDKYGIVVDNDQTLKSTIIGRTQEQINISAVISQSGEMTTSIENNGSSLGDYTGTGHAQGKMDNDVTYTASDYTYLFSFACIVPRIGYYQGVNPEYFRNEKWDYYSPEMDSMGFMPQPSAMLHIATNGVNGVVPRYMDYKFDNLDVISGDLDLCSRINSMAPYFYQRMISGDETLRKINNGTLVFSDEFRKIGLNDTLGNYLRIFQNTDPLNDHFIVSIIHDIKSTAPMKPIIDSFDTVDDEQSSDVTNKA